jgi:phosphoglycolate phosphatase-like HAD superfamily hydrolase
MIEDKEWLKYDVPFTNVTEYLHSLKKKEYQLYIITARQSKAKAIQQIVSFGWKNLFNEILVTEQKNRKKRSN